MHVLTNTDKTAKKFSVRCVPPSGYHNEQRFDVALLADFSPSPGWITENQSDLVTN